MSASLRRIWCFFGLVVAAGCFEASCSKSKSIDVGTGCLLNSDCNSPLSCTFGKCHDMCKDTRDCSAGERCVKLSTGSVCQLPADADCQFTGLCGVGLVCAADQSCRAGCQTAADCLSAQSCVGGVCADANDLDTSGQLQQKGVLGAACTLNGDCNSPLSCIMNTCHYLCQNTNVCPAEQSCLKTSTGSVCQLPAEAGCDSATPCPVGLLCATDARCRAVCKSASDCTAGQTCVGGVCADKSDLGSNGQLIPKTLTKPDGGTDAQGMDVGQDTNLGIGGAVEAGGSNSSGGAGGTRDSGTPDVAGTGGVIASGGSTGTRDGGTPDAAMDRPSDSAIEADAPGPTVLDGGASTVLTGCARVTTKRYFCDDFESGLGNWQYGIEGWGLTADSYQSASHAVTDSPNGNYLKNAGGDLTMVQAIDLTDSVSPVVTFWQRLSLACPSSNSYLSCCAPNPNGCDMVCANGICSDIVYVDVSADGGDTWSTLKAMAFTANTSTWSFQQISLSDYIGKKIKLRFRLWDNNDNSQADGWYLDDLEVREADLPPPSSLDGGTSTRAAGEGPGCNGSPIGVRYFCDDFENGLNQWMVAATGWNTVTTASQSTSHSVSDSPNGNYAAGSQSEMTMATSVDLGSAVSPVLTFWQRLVLACSSAGSYLDCCTPNPPGCSMVCANGICSDIVYVEASSNGGSTWSTLKSMSYTSNSSTWSFQQVSLAAYTGKMVKLRFRLWDNNDNSQADGWFVDDVKIRENDFSPMLTDLAMCTNQSNGAQCLVTDNSGQVYVRSLCTAQASGGECGGVADSCRKACGPNNLGNKALTCSQNKLVESGCTFSVPANYACYKVTSAAACATGTKAGQACTATACQACGATTGTGYLDTSGAAKQGFCVCSGGKWSCGTTAEWPCYPNPAVTGATVPASCN